MELAQYDIANLGFGVSANVPRILLEEGLDGEVTWVIEQGCPECGFTPPEPTEVAQRVRATIPRFVAALQRAAAPDRPGGR